MIIHGGSLQIKKIQPYNAMLLWNEQYGWQVDHESGIVTPVWFRGGGKFHNQWIFV